MELRVVIEWGFVLYRGRRMGVVEGEDGMRYRIAMLRRHRTFVDRRQNLIDGAIHRKIEGVRKRQRPNVLMREYRDAGNLWDPRE